jgi:hypothetical protein
VSGTRFPTTDQPARPGATSIRLRGGLTIWARFGNHFGYIMPILAPYESTLPALAASTEIVPSSTLPADIRDKVLPVDFTIPVGSTREYLLRASDPLVNQYPGDWEALQNPAAADITMVPAIDQNSRAYKKGGTATVDPFFSTANVTLRVQNSNSDNPGFRPSGGGDPLSIWLPRLDPRIPKLARVPSVGALFSIRTGLFPDRTIAALHAKQQKGVPFRALNMAPSTQSSQSTDGGSSYPDWAMLDLFTVPFLPQKPYGPATTATGLAGGTPVAGPLPFRRLTYGGATVGRMNINNPPVPYPYAQDASVNTSPPRRRALQARFFGLKPSISYNAAGEPVYTTINATAATSLADAIAAYQATNGPFFMAGEIANVPAVANYLYSFGSQTTGPSRTASISRNDLVRDTIGAITTRSNVFSIWVVAQTIKKKPGNTAYGTFEPGDKVTSEVRRRYLVERFIDTGADGVPGNAVAPSVANTPNAYSSTRPNGDNVTAADPKYQPALTYPLPYRWRVVAVENIQM